jgi:hypothetical protein
MPAPLLKKAPSQDTEPQQEIPIQREVATTFPELRGKCIEVPEDVWKILMLVKELGGDDETVNFIRKKFGPRLREQIPEELNVLIRILS